jgi:hypothetical protein
MAKFLTKIERKSVDPIEFEDLVRMKNYQLALVDEMLYYNKSTTESKHQKKADFILLEINNIERWLKEKFKDFTNDNKRKLFA